LKVMIAASIVAGLAFAALGDLLLGLLSFVSAFFYAAPSLYRLFRGNRLPPMPSRPRRPPRTTRRRDR
jgi:hypothetical protein